MAEAGGPELPLRRSRTAIFIAAVLGSMLLPWVFMASLQAMRPDPVHFDLDQVEALFGEERSEREAGVRTLRIQSDRSRASSGGPWPESVSFIVARREAAIHEAPLHFTLQTAPEEGEALARSVFLTGRTPIRRVLRRHAPAPGDSVNEAELVRELNEVLGETTVQRVIVQPIEEAEATRPSGHWTWPPEPPDAARRGLLKDRPGPERQQQVQLWDMGDETWPLDLPTLALGLAPFPVHQHRHGWGRAEVAGDGGYGLWLTDGRYLVGAVTGPGGDPEDALASLPFVQSVGTRAPLAAPYELFDRHTILILLTLIGCFLVLWALGVIRGASWAAERRPPARGQDADRERLKQELMTLGDRLVVHTREDQSLEIRWRLEDPAVQNAMRAADGQIGYTVALILEVDQARCRVRCQERRVRLLWMKGEEREAYAHQTLSSAATGVDFIDRGQGWMEGRSLDADAPMDLAPAAMKHLVSRVILDAGWTYRPVLSFQRWISG